MVSIQLKNREGLQALDSESLSFFLTLLPEVLEQLGFGAVVFDKNMKIVGANRTFWRMVDCADEEPLGCNLREFLPERDAGQLEGCFAWLGTPNGDGENETGGEHTARRERVSSIEGGPQEIELVSRSGARVVARMRSSRWFVTRDAGYLILLCLDDVTSAKEAEKKKLSEINLIRNIIQTSQEGIVAADMKGNVILFNEGAEKLLGWKAEEVIGKVKVTAFYPPGVAQEIMRKLRLPEFGGVGRLTAQNFIGIAKDGERIPVSLSASLIYEDGKEVASVGIFTDLRERTRLQKRLEEMKLQVFQAEKMASLGKLAAGVAHEINNPLAGILLYTSILKKKVAQDKEAEADLGRIISDATRCKEIVQGLLDFARQGEQKKTLINLNKTLDNALSLLGNQATLQKVSVERDFDPSLPPVMANSTQINQVLINLVMNALDAMPEGGRLTVRTKLSADGTTVLFEVCDTGKGIPPSYLPRIFEPFFTTKEVGKGTGLGLCIVYGIVEEHGGKIGVKSTVGHGTTFTIELPTWRQREGAAAPWR